MTRSAIIPFSYDHTAAMVRLRALLWKLAESGSRVIVKRDAIGPYARVP